MNLRGTPNKKEDPSKIPRLSTGSDLLDLASGGGYGFGKMVNLIGDKSSGKTLLATECIARAYERFGKTLHWYYNDCESGFSFDTKKIYGLDIVPYEEKDESETIEHMIMDLKKRIYDKPSTDPMIYVVDSVEGMTCQAEISRSEDRDKALQAGKTYDVGSYNTEKSRLMNEFFRLHINDLRKTNTLLIMVSQIRDKMGVTFGEKTCRQCEKALDFYASQVIKLRECEKMKKTVSGVTYPIGVCIEAHVKKNKLGIPFKKAFIEILFDYGVDNTSANLSYLYDLVTETGKSRKAIDVTWEDIQFKKKEKLLAYIEKKDGEKKVLKAVTKKWDGILSKLEPKRKKKLNFIE